MNEIVYDGMDLDAIKTPEELINPFEGHTAFAEVYNRFLGKITDDMYMELTPEDTIRDLKNLLINAIPGFEFPRQVIDDYIDCVEEKSAEDLLPVDFVIGEVESGRVLIERSYFVSKLTSEEINILAILMLEGWVQRQVSSIEVTRMKYSGPDFKMTSQANHLSKLMALLKEVQRQSLHMQRLYKRRKVDPKTGQITSNWSVFSSGKRFDD